MFYTYVLRSLKDKKLYIGHSEEPVVRLKEHNNGRTPSTRHRVPFELIYKKEFMTRNEARWQERKWKSAWGHKQIYDLIKVFPK